jgi:hypothetical protein
MRWLMNLISSGLFLAAAMTLIGGLLNTFLGLSLALSAGGSSTPFPSDVVSTMACAGVLAFLGAGAWGVANFSTLVSFGRRRPGVVLASLFAFLSCLYGAYFALAGGTLGLANENNDGEAVRRALEQGGVPQEELDGHLYQALKAGRLESAKALLAGGADPNHLTPEGRATLLVDGVVFFPKEAVLLLLDSGADPNREDTLGRTAAHTLLLYRFEFRSGETEDNVLEILRALGEYGADLKKPNREGKTPLDLAQSSGLKSVAGWLSKPRP